MNTTDLSLADRLTVLHGAARARLLTAVRRSDRLRALTAIGRAAAAVAVGDRTTIDRLTAQPDELRDLLTTMMIEDAGGRSPTAADRDRLRSLAVARRIRDADGLAIAALRTLAERFDDPAARAWLGPALAEAGRLAEAVEAGPVFGPGRPRARHYVILVTALTRLGREAEAAELMALLHRRLRGLRSEFVDRWSDDPLGRAYAAEVAAPREDDTLPVFQHLPFCAGSSMQFSLQLVVPWGLTQQIGRRSGLVEIAELAAAGRSRAAELMLVHQHHPYALQLPGRRLRHFTVLRDPVSQLRSGFFKRAAREQIVTTRDAGSATFADHAAYTIAAGMTNMLTRMIITTHPELQAAYRRHFDRPAAFAPIRHEEDMFWLRATRGFDEQRLLRLARETLDENFAVVGTMKHLVASHLACTAATGVPVAHRLGHRGRSGQPPVREDDAVERRLREANAVDQQLYEEYTARFVRDHADLIAAVTGETGDTADTSDNADAGDTRAAAPVRTPGGQPAAAAAVSGPAR